VGLFAFHVSWSVYYGMVYQRNFNDISWWQNVVAKHFATPQKSKKKEHVNELLFVAKQIATAFYRQTISLQ
jgi:hypothetical protein